MNWYQELIQQNMLKPLEIKADILEQFTAPGKYHYELEMGRIISDLKKGIEIKYSPMQTSKMPSKGHVTKKNIQQTYNGIEKQWRKDLR